MEYLIHSEKDKPRTAAPIALGGEAIIVITPPILAEYAIPRIKNLDSAVITLTFNNPSKPIMEKRKRYRMNLFILNHQKALFNLIVLALQVFFCSWH